MREISLILLNCGMGGNGDGITNAIARLGENMAASRCSLLDYNDENRGFDLFQQWCAPGTAPLEADFHIPAVVVAPYHTRLLRGEAVIVSRDRTDRDNIEYSLLEAGGAHSVLCLPILRDGSLEGVLILSFPTSQPELQWPAEIRPLQVTADLIGAALARKRLAGELEHQASHDVLTGLNNRRKFEELLLQEIERTSRYQRPFAVIMFDIDHFKRINDRHGHDIGDAVLNELATIVGEQVRDSDIPARWGGEEFIVLLPETGTEGARQAAEGRLRRRIAETLFTGAGRVTISLGVTQYQSGDTLDSLVKRADEALYRAKEEGRDRVVVG
ncbi:GGDEF domain-containing protein [Thiohalobacter thiocyanaticus]|uniref:GGDEF domain-containing protein n=1 Tax=Thiohalobacter thiocyanaticus TaxID=585455 RepID=UPI001F4E940D|nr:sensor domain-containing diguanylate cyclase [Thiohalobacter thiocyanaticus]